MITVSLNFEWIMSSNFEEIIEWTNNIELLSDDWEMSGYLELPDHYIKFKHEKDAIAFRIRFGV